MSIWVDNDDIERQKKPSAWRRFIDTITYRKERAALRTELNAIEDRLQAIEAVLEHAETEQMERTERRGSEWDVLG